MHLKVDFNILKVMVKKTHTFRDRQIDREHYLHSPSFLMYIIEIISHLLGSVLGRSGAPSLSLQLGYCAR